MHCGHIFDLITLPDELIDMGNFYNVITCPKCKIENHEDELEYMKDIVPNSAQKIINQREIKIMAKRNETRVITNKVRLSYANLFEPKSINGGDEKYSVSLLIPKTDKETLKLIKEAIATAKEAGKGKWAGKIPAVLKEPLRDGDEERPDDEVYAGCYFINASSKNKPGLVNQLMKEIESEDELYSGCYARVSINFYAFNANGNKGIACGLNNVQKLADGERLGGGFTNPSSDFEEVEIEADEDDSFLG